MRRTARGNNESTFVMSTPIRVECVISEVYETALVHKIKTSSAWIKVEPEQGVNMANMVDVQ